MLNNRLSIVLIDILYIFASVIAPQNITVALHRAIDEHNFQM